MNSRRLVLIAPLLTATGMFAQVIPAPPPPPDVMFGTAGQMGPVVMPGAIGMAGIVSAGFSLVGKPVTGAPYSAVETTQSIQTLADGNRIVHSNTALSYRDSQGRTRHEVTLPAIGGTGAPPALITISDPTTGVTYSLNPTEKTAWKMPSPKLADEQYAKLKILPSPPGTATMIFTAPAGDAQPSRSHEDLGTQEMEGVSAQGTRDTTVIPAGAMGNERPITIVQEQWFSPDLKIQLKTLRDDPRMGQTSLTVSDLKRGEPDPSLFQVPSDYAIQEGPSAPKSMLEFHKAQ